MIAFVEGKITVLEPTYVILATGGIGYHINIPLSTYSTLKEAKEAKLHTHFHVKEDSQSLYGFHTEKTKTLFKLLISVSGIGPNTGLMVLSSMEYDEVVNAIAMENVNSIKQVKGIGAKTAERLVLELKDKIRKLASGNDVQEPSFSKGGQQTNSFGLQEEAITALTTLGISKNVAEKSIQSALKKDPSMSLEQLIKFTLKGN
ncbi:MAG: Holliday junction branch migration protein RuvA [Cyclobacteriaceae bacterium]